MTDMSTLLENGTSVMTTTTEDYDYYNIVTESTKPETIIGDIDAFNNVEAILLEFLVSGTVLAYVTFLAVLYILGSARKRNIECYLIFKHTIFSLLNQTCITVSFVFFKEVEFQVLLKQIQNYITLCTPFWTLSLSIKAFTNIVLSRDVYSAKELTVFCYSSVALIQLYEDVVIYIIDLTEYDGPKALAAIRMTSVTFVMCVTISIVPVIVFYLVKEPRSSTKKSHHVLKLLNIFILTLFDSLIVAFAVVSTCQDTTLKLVTALILCTRLVLEMFWSTAFEYWSMSKSR